MAAPFSQPIRQELRKRVEGRLGGLRGNRYGYWLHWRELAQFILPRRYLWLVTPNRASRGSPINQNIINDTGTQAARTLAAGLLAGLTNPMAPWFKFTIDGFEDESSTVVRWLSECTKRMLAVFQESNFYNSMAILLYDLIVFGTATQIIYEDFENVITCYNPALGEFFIDVSYKLEGNVFYREFTRTIDQIVDEFGLDSCPLDVKKAYEAGGPALTRERVVIHAIDYNTRLGDAGYAVPPSFKWREVYWIAGSARDEVLRIKGFPDFPVGIVRWDTKGNDAYGYSLGMDALGDIKQLQQEEKRKGQGIDKMVNPPMVADVAMKNQPASGLPGGVTYVPGFGRERPGFAPAYTVQPNIAEMRQDINGIEQRIKACFFNYLFTSVTDLQTVRSAEEIRARQNEKVLMVPYVKRIDKEAIQWAINRTWNIMLRANLLPKPFPQEIVGQLIKIKYTGPFAMSMLAAETTAIEQTYTFAGNIAGVKPEVLDNLDVDATIHIVASALGADPRILLTDEARDAVRAARAQQAQQAQMAQTAGAAAQGAQVLSDTNVGGGQNALQLALGRG